MLKICSTQDAIESNIFLFCMNNLSFEGMFLALSNVYKYITYIT